MPAQPSTTDEATVNADPKPAGGRLPPTWVIRSAWVVHRGIYNLSRGRIGLRRATDRTWGMMRLRTIGRRSGQERIAILGYYEDGPNLVTMAMNGWMHPEPAWWLNLQAQPDAIVELADGPRRVHGRAATSTERERLWNRWRTYDGEGIDGWAARRPGQTAVVILEPRD